MSFFKNFFEQENYDYSNMLENILLEMKKYFLQILKKNKKISHKDIMKYLTIQIATFNQLSEKPKKNDKQYTFMLEKSQPLLKSFQFYILLHDMPEFFCLEVEGFNEYEGFLLSLNSNEEKIKVTGNHVGIVKSGHPTKYSKKLANKMLKKKIFTKY